MRGKSILLLCSLAMVFSLTACGGGNNNANNGANNGGAGTGSTTSQSANQGMNQNGSQSAAQGGAQNGAQSGGQNGSGGGAQSGGQNGSGSSAQSGSQRKVAYQQGRTQEYLKDGKYAAYSDGEVKGGSNALGRDVANGAENFMNGVRRAARDVGDGVKNGNW